MLAKKSGQPISCFYIAVEQAWILNSWARMIIPKPFSRPCAYFSSPMPVPVDASEEQMAALHQQMQEPLDRCRVKAEPGLTTSQARVLGRSVDRDIRDLHAQ